MDSTADRHSLSWASQQGQGAPRARAGAGGSVPALQKKGGAKIGPSEDLFKKYLEVEYSL